MEKISKHFACNKPSLKQTLKRDREGSCVSSGSGTTRTPEYAMHVTNHVQTLPARQTCSEQHIRGYTTRLQIKIAYCFAFHVIFTDFRDIFIEAVTFRIGAYSTQE